VAFPVDYGSIGRSFAEQLAGALILHFWHQYKHRRSKERDRILSERLDRLERTLSLPSMFPLLKRQVSGYVFGERTFYSSHHVGVDYHADEGTPLYAPFNGTIVEAFAGVEGGNTIWFKPDNQDVIIRFLHLSRFESSKGQHVTAGTEIAKTGHSGKIVGTDGQTYIYAPHLHLDISKGSVVLSWPGNFIDPETFEWNDLHNVDEPVNGTPAQVSVATINNVPIDFTITTLYRAHFRQSPSLSAPIMATYNKGTTVECAKTVQGDSVTVGNVTSTKWYQSKNHGWFISAATCNHN